MNILQRLLILAVMTCFCLPLAAQSTKSADKAFQSEEYYKAAAAYKDALPKLYGTDKAYIQYRVGECYRRMNKPEEAVIWFADADKGGCKKPELYYSYGDMLTILGKYEEARKYFQKYRNINPTDNRVERKLSAIEFALAYSKVNPFATLKPVDAINTTGSEYGVAYFGNKLVYASTGDANVSSSESTMSMRTGLGYSKIYMTEPNEGANYVRGTEVKEFNQDRSNDGTFSYDERTNMAYYTRCEANENACYIYFAEQSDGKWKEKGRLKIDGKIMQLAHPCVSPDGNRIYFSAMMDGGYGGSDIWYIEKNGSSWSKAINAGREINTSGNEVFPFVTEDMLFFSSDGHDGYGGLDVYASKISYGSHGKAVNLRPPFNTSYDDFNLIVRNDGKEGMLVSNRRNAKSSDDIFSFDGFPVVLLASGHVRDKETEAPIPNAVVMVNNGKKDEPVIADSTGYYYTFLKPQQKYNLAVDENGYIPQKKDLPTTGVSYPVEFSPATGYDMDFLLDKEKEPELVRSIAGKVYEKETGKRLANEPVYLYADGKKASAKRTDNNGNYAFDNVQPNVQYRVKVENNEYFAEAKDLKIKETDKKPLYSLATGSDMDIALTKIKVGEEIEIEDIYYDLDKANLLPESKVELNKLIKLLSDNPGMKVQISSHTDARGRAEYNQKLSEARAKSVVDYLVESGISAKRLTWKGYGKTRLRIPNANTEEEHRKNRRTTFKVLELGAAPVTDFESFGKSDEHKTVVSTVGGVTTVTTVPTGSNTGTSTTTSTAPSTDTKPATTTTQASSGESNFTVQVSIAGKLDMTDPKIRKIEKELGVKVWYQKGSDNRYRYYVGKYRDRDQAADMVKQVKAAGVSDCFIKDLRK